MNDTPPHPNAAGAPTPAQLVDSLVGLMRLEPLGNDRFRAQSEDIGTPALYGGQVLGQALMAASLTVDAARPVHSLHAYFLLPGLHEPVDYVVDRVRDGRSFSMRHVVACQQGRTIFELAASFQTRDPGLEHQSDMPPAPAPEDVPTDIEQRRGLADGLPEPRRTKLLSPHGLEFRSTGHDNWLEPTPRPDGDAIWMRAVAPLPDDPAIHRALATYASDRALLRAAPLRHGLGVLSGRLRMASLDHAMWFHHDFRFDDWVLYVVESPAASGARALCFGRMYTRDGRLVASTAQEGMVRVRRPSPPA